MMSFSCKLSDGALDNGALVILGALAVNPPLILYTDTSRPRTLGRDSSAVTWEARD